MDTIEREQEQNRADAIADLNAGTDTGDTDALVRPEWGCPTCGERRQDWLSCGDDDSIRCETCGCIYEI
jgi:hypothetical protein